MVTTISKNMTLHCLCVCVGIRLNWGGVAVYGSFMVQFHLQAGWTRFIPFFCHFVDRQLKSLAIAVEI